MYADIKPVFRPADKSLIGYEIVNDIEAIKNSLNNLFLIRLGEVPGKPYYGNGLYEILFDPMDQFIIKFIKEHITNQLEKYEPRVILESLDVANNPEYNKIDIHLKYYVVLKDEKYYETLIIRDLNTITTSRTNV